MIADSSGRLVTLWLNVRNRILSRDPPYLIAPEFSYEIFRIQFYQSYG